jgi:uncharacterized protein
MESLISQPLIKWGIAAAFILGALLLGVMAITEIKQWSFIGSGTTATNTISVSGKGEIFAVPTIAEFTLTVTKEGKDVKTAQKDMTDKMNDIIAYVRSQGIAEKDIKTTNYGVNPQYDYVQKPCPQPQYGCPGGEQKLRGFQVSQTISVKVRDNTDKAGDILANAGAKGATDIGSLNFINDEEDKLKDEARAKAIRDAKDKAAELAKQLGVTIVRVVNFSEDGGYQPQPMFQRMEKAVMMDATAGAAPSLPVGENKIQSNVTVVFEIR